MAKPTDIVEWATDGGATQVEPSSGEKETGFEGGEDAAAEKVNWILATLGLWTAWQDTTFTDTGVPTATRTIVIAGAAGQPSETGTAFQFEGAATGGSASSWEVDSGSTPSSGDRVHYGLTLAVGDRIRAVRAYIRGAAVGGETLTVALRKNVGTDGTASTIGTPAASNGLATPTHQTLTVGSLTEVVAGGGISYEVVVYASAAFDAARVYSIEVDVDHPTV